MTERKHPRGCFFFVASFLPHPAFLPSSESLCSLHHTLHLQYRTLDQGWRGAHFASELSNQRRGRSVIAVKETLMKFFVWLIRVLVFVLLLVLALANTQTATLNFLAGYSWQLPVILIGLGFFVVGLLAGLLWFLPTVFRVKMENGRLKRDLRTARDVPVVPQEPPMPPLI
jgi:lipopolysaccharide assembly protein A